MKKAIGILGTGLIGVVTGGLAVNYINARSKKELEKILLEKDNEVSNLEGVLERRVLRKNEQIADLMDKIEKIELEAKELSDTDNTEAKSMGAKEFYNKWVKEKNELLRKKDDEIKKLKEKLNKLHKHKDVEAASLAKEKVEKLKKEIVDLKNKNKDLLMKVATNEKTMEKFISEHKKEIDKLEKEKLMLTTKTIDSEHELIEDNEKITSHYKSVVKDLHKEIESKEKEIQQFREELAKEINNNAKANVLEIEFERLLECYIEDLEDMCSKYNEQDEESRKIKEELRIYKGDLRRIKKSNEKLREEVEQAKGNNDKRNKKKIG